MRLFKIFALLAFIFLAASITKAAYVQTDVLSYAPALQGATDNPAATYTVQNGWYMINNKMLHFGFQLKTSTMSKTTLSDRVRVSLPRARSAGGADIIVLCRSENSILSQNANQGIVSPATAYVELHQQTLTSARSAITYALTSLGLLSGNVTIECSGSYNID